MNIKDPILNLKKHQHLKIKESRALGKGDWRGEALGKQTTIVHLKGIWVLWPLPPSCLSILPQLVPEQTALQLSDPK